MFLISIIQGKILRIKSLNKDNQGSYTCKFIGIVGTTFVRKEGFAKVNIQRKFLYFLYKEGNKLNVIRLSMISTRSY